MTEKKWEILTKVKNGDVIASLLENRGITTEKEKKIFFDPPHPGKISLKEWGISANEMKKALARIKKAKNSGEKVIVYGDYDCDGVCASAIVWHALSKKGINVWPFIPNRFSDGYGMRPSTIERIKKEHPEAGLIISVDNGIVAHEACKVAAKLGIDVIITDHHEQEKTLPKSVALIHTTKTSGSAVAWILAREIGDADDLLAFATIGTVADQLPLIGVNRSLVKHGLASLPQSSSIGLLALLRAADIDPKSVGTYEIGYVIAPRINAMGRMGDAMDALRLLCTPNVTRAEILSRQLDKTNIQRQTVVETAVAHASQLAKESGDTMLTVLAHESYHEGIIGLAASRLVEVFGKPAIVIAKGEVFSKGSARSISGFHITYALREVRELLVEMGGHEMAAGFTIETAKLEEFMEKMQTLATAQITVEMLVKKVRVDCEVNFAVLSWQLSEKLKQFEPFGIGNPQPTFATSDIQILDVKQVGQEGKHAKFKVKEEQVTMDAIAFGWGQSGLEVGQNVSMAYNLETNIWQNVKSLQLKIKDIKTSQS